MKVYHSKYIELKNEANQLTIQLEPLEKVNQLRLILQIYHSFWFLIG
jgi:hypothetical protein